MSVKLGWVLFLVLVLAVAWRLMGMGPAGQPETDAVTAVPVKLAVAPKAAWGPVFHGLQAKLTANTAKPQVGQPFSFTFSLRNVGPRTRYLFDGFVPARGLALLTQGGTISATNLMGELLTCPSEKCYETVYVPRAPSIIEIKPGETKSFTVVGRLQEIGATAGDSALGTVSPRKKYALVWGDEDYFLWIQDTQLDFSFGFCTVTTQDTEYVDPAFALSFFNPNEPLGPTARDYEWAQPRVKGQSNVITLEFPR